MFIDAICFFVFGLSRKYLTKETLGDGKISLSRGIAWLLSSLRPLRTWLIVALFQMNMAHFRAFWLLVLEIAMILISHRFFLFFYCKFFFFQCFYFQQLFFNFLFYVVLNIHVQLTDVATLHLIDIGFLICVPMFHLSLKVTHVVNIYISI